MKLRYIEEEENFEEGEKVLENMRGGDWTDEE